MRVLIAVLLLIAVTPIVPEAVEAGVHVVVHGDLPHHDEHEHETDQPGSHDQGDEHGCTPLFHSCGCHLPMSAAPAASTASATVILDHQAEVALPSQLDRGRVGEPPPLRPPIG